MCLAIGIAFILAVVAISHFAAGDIASGLGWSFVCCAVVVGIVLYCRSEDQAAAAAAREREAEAWRTRMTLIPAVQWLSPSPIAADTKVVVTFCGVYLWHCNDVKRYLDACFSWNDGTRPAQYRAHHSLYFDGSDVPAQPFREDRLHNRYDFLYTGTGKELAIFLERTHQHERGTYHNPNYKIIVSIGPPSAADEAFLRVQEEEERRRQQEEAEAERRREAVELEAERRDRFRTLQARYGDALLAWRTKDEELVRYAREHRDELLASHRQREIIDDYDAFHTEDLDFVEWLRINHRILYHRTAEVFFYRALAIAESLPKEEKPHRPKLTPEERQVKFARYRERALERDRIQAEDRMAAVRQKLDLLRQFREDLAAYDLDEDERDRLVKEFENDLFSQSEEHADGTFKKL